MKASNSTELIKSFDQLWSTCPEVLADEGCIIGVGSHQHPWTISFNLIKEDFGHSVVNEGRQGTSLPDACKRREALVSPSAHHQLARIVAVKGAG